MLVCATATNKNNITKFTHPISINLYKKRGKNTININLWFIANYIIKCLQYFLFFLILNEGSRVEYTKQRYYYAEQQHTLKVKFILFYALRQENTHQFIGIFKHWWERRNFKKFYDLSTGNKSGTSVHFTITERYPFPSVQKFQEHRN